MIHSQQVTSTADLASLYDLIGQTNSHTDGIWLQWVSGTLNYGSRSTQPFTLATGSTVEGFFLPRVTDTKNIFVSGVAVFNVGMF